MKNKDRYVKSLKKRITDILKVKTEFYKKYINPKTSLNLKEFDFLFLTDDVNILFEEIKHKKIEKKYTEMNSFLTEQINSFFEQKVLKEYLMNFFEKELIYKHKTFLLKTLCNPANLKDITYNKPSEKRLKKYINKKLPYYCPKCGRFISKHSLHLQKVCRGDYIYYTSMVLITHYRHKHSDYICHNQKNYDNYKKKKNEEVKKKVIGDIEKCPVLKSDIKRKLLSYIKTNNDT